MSKAFQQFQQQQRQQQQARQQRQRQQQIQQQFQQQQWQAQRHRQMGAAWLADKKRKEKEAALRANRFRANPGLPVNRNLKRQPRLNVSANLSESRYGGSYEEDDGGSWLNGCLGIFALLAIISVATIACIALVSGF